ncbi:MAG TPA: FtsK/SpoIIIE domain-containing protein [Anaerolineales bacterium]|nr:FtsK/SpoIIIE domain-containing protein [Anaerolineales bacterium]
MNNRRFSLALEALAELKADESAPPPVQQMPVAPTLSEVLAGIGPLPREALLMGVASDGLPVLLNLRDPLPGPILVVGDAGVGKTIFLQTMAQSVLQSHDPNNVQYGVITNHPEEWESVVATAHRAGLFSPDQAGAQDIIVSLASWAHANRNARQSVLLLIDDLEVVANLDADTLQSFRWLLLRGPARRVWPVITLSAEKYTQVVSWLQSFRTRIFGRIVDQRIAGALGADKTSALDQLEARIQFALRENGNWLRFWMPSF